MSIELKNIFLHFRTITRHKNEVMKLCFKCGLYRQGLLHDLSKYSPVEFIPGVKYYQGTRSPNDIERRTEGRSSAWLHHKGRNRHHYEYWTDYVLPDGKNYNGTVGPIPMPRKYIAEMFCDRVAACKIYNGENYDKSQPLAYINRSKDRMMIHPDTKKEIIGLLTLCDKYGEDAVCRFIKEKYLKKR